MILKGWKKKSDSDQKYLFQNLEGFMKKIQESKLKYTNLLRTKNIFKSIIYIIYQPKCQKFLCDIEGHFSL